MNRDTPASLVLLALWVFLTAARGALGDERSVVDQNAASAAVHQGEAVDKIATFSIVAVDVETQICGAAVGSKYPAVGRVVPYVRSGVGAFCTQHYHVPKWGELALDKLQRGDTVESVIVQLLRDDSKRDQRQLSLIDIQGRATVHHPIGAPLSSRYWGSMIGRNYACQGNTLTGRPVITQMAAAFEDTRGSLADRLVAALVAADRAGGDHRGRLAAGIRLAHPTHQGYWLELYVDDHPNAVEELVRRYLRLDHPAKGRWSGPQTE